MRQSFANVLKQTEISANFNRFTEFDFAGFWINGDKILPYRYFKRNENVTYKMKYNSKHNIYGCVRLQFSSFWNIYILKWKNKCKIRHWLRSQLGHVGAAPPLWIII